MILRQSALLVPVFNADAVFGAVRERLDPAAKRGVPAHITVLYPFLAPEALDPAVLSELRSFFAAHASFRFSLSRTAWFGDSVLWLAPEPDAPFRVLTDAVAARWPDHTRTEAASRTSFHT